MSGLIWNVIDILLYKKYLKEHGILLFTPTQTLKVTNFTFTCAFSNNYDLSDIIIDLLQSG